MLSNMQADKGNRVYKAADQSVTCSEHTIQLSFTLRTTACVRRIHESAVSHERKTYAVQFSEKGATRPSGRDHRRHLSPLLPHLQRLSHYAH